MSCHSWFLRVVSASIAILMMPWQADCSDGGTLPDVVEFNRDIRPLLSDNCFYCHGPDKNKREADLRLDTEAGLTGPRPDESKPKIVVPGKPELSELIRRVHSSNPDDVMPPPDSGKQLTAREMGLLKRWVEQGAPYEGHWSFLPIKRPAVPVVTTNETVTQEPIASKNAIDAFIRQKLAELQQKPSAEADRITLIRRLSFDVTGLPPTPEQVAAFVQDQSADAYERLVDRLLESPHFGERLAVWWLDLVRYADTVGYHGDQTVNVAPFRQYVIDSFNANKRFDQFTVEQLAGDLLNNPTREQKIASGYNRLGMMSAEGGVQDKEYLAKYIAERVRNASGTWMGVTLGCAECHDHKFDPFTSRDFYRFEAFFADIEERGLYAGAYLDGNFGRSIKVPTVEQERDLAQLDQSIREIKSVIDLSTPELLAAQATWESTQSTWSVLTPDQFSSAGGSTLTLKEDGSILVSGTNPSNDAYVLTFKQPRTSITALRLEVLADESLPAKGPGRAGNGNFVLTEFEVRTQPTGVDPLPIALQNPTASFEQSVAAEGNPYGKWLVTAAIDGDAKGKNWGWAVLDKVGQPHVAIFETAMDLSCGDDAPLTITLRQGFDSQHNIGRFRIAATTTARPVKFDPAIPPSVVQILSVAAINRTPEQQAELSRFYRTIAPQLETARQQLADVEKRRKELDARIPSSLITASVTPRMVRVLPRGNWMDDKGEVVTPAFPGIFSSSETSTTRLTRLDLARWLTAANNPLTARVFVNRVWKLLFGSGLSRRVDDLGAQGEPPSHPQLLEHLAGCFIDSGWDIKQLIKTILMSETYRQTSLARHELREFDPYNRWLARQGRFRLDAEFVRDDALAVSGLLVTTIGGVSVKPYQPPGYWAHLNFPIREWQNGHGEDLYRRGLYTHWQRQYLHPSLQAFDAPSREECTVDRPRSNTPLQSLVLLNDPSYVEAARAFAELILRHGGSDDAARMDFAFRRAVSRAITPAEIGVLQQLLQKHRDEYRSDTDAATHLLSVGDRPVPTDLDQGELAAWTSVARTILNLHEVITRN
ncbi:PSD1 and planctomycete cytochrome C domain-containing protein [Schlesneria paludicola]|uniref:PSD1 and planctomycete cytochrome C domain-containing protein n=1 Tax=Schlesneria paludicola TaxID=360056 RepID=UPI00029A1A85|nr:PSD1 and planctomycete cytochrome C domain-containing protein [Schlesneria paludicola]